MIAAAHEEAFDAFELIAAFDAASCQSFFQRPHLKFLGVVAVVIEAVSVDQGCLN